MLTLALVLLYGPIYTSEKKKPRIKLFCECVFDGSLWTQMLGPFTHVTAHLRKQYVSIKMALAISAISLLSPYIIDIRILQCH